jgi:hypothetical protein
MPSSRAAIADAVTSMLNAASGSSTFSGVTFKATRKYVPANQLKDLDGLVLTVPPIGPEQRTLEARKLIQKVFSVDIGIQKRLTPGCNPESAQGNAEVDALMLFAEQVAAFFEPPGPTNGSITATTAWWVGTAIEPAYDPAHLRELRVFTSRVILTVRYY